MSWPNIIRRDALLDALAKHEGPVPVTFEGEQVGVLRKSFVTEEVKEVDGESRVLRFVISTGGVDRDNDTIDPKGWDLKNYLRNPVVLWAHDYRQLPVGRARSVTLDGGNLVSECEFADHPFAETVLRMVKGGFLKATSVGFKPKKYTINEERRGLDFTEQELMEYSIVPVPANPEALIDMAGAKAAGIDVEPLRAWAKSVMADASAEAEVVTVAVDGKALAEAAVAALAPAVAVAADKAPAADDGEDPEDDEDEDEKDAAKCCGCPERPVHKCAHKGCGHKMCEKCSRPAKDGDERVCACHKTAEAEVPTCRLCAQALKAEVPRLRDDLGLVCAPCFLRAATPAALPADVPPAAAPTKEATAEESVLDLDDDPSAEVVVELDDEGEEAVELTPDEVRDALREAITGTVSTIVREETRAALNRARGRVD